MSLLQSVRLGVQRPQIVHLPPDVVSLDAATETIELADSYTICDGHPLDESQRFTLRAALGERADGSWAASTVADFEPRQNGKNDTCNARELAGLILFGERLLIHTAHEFPTANESFLRLVAVFENWDDLRRKVARIRYANGEQGIELLDGARLKYRARTGGSGRGFARADLVVYDEAQKLAPEHVAASAPAKLANKNSQAWYLGSGGMENSVNAWRLRKRALSGDGGRLAYVEHTAEHVSVDAEGKVVSYRPDVLDREAWAAANAAYGYRITDEKLLDLYGELGPDLFARECLCIWDPLLEDEVEQLVIDPEDWLAVTDLSSVALDPVVFGIDASPDRRWATICVAANRRGGGQHIEVVDRRSGVPWLVNRIVELKKAWPDSAVVIDPISPAGSIIVELEALEIEVTKATTQAVVASCGAFLDATKPESRTLHYRPTEHQAAMSAAVFAARKRDVGSAWAWDRKNSESDITPLVAATLAFGALPAAKTAGFFVY